ncbi:uncharacterized protein LOC122638854 [Telopea speciosissima]|uniref:uncharacterized protein LOC122638854 n=1 Tax=Telopea speciosissima TaxID=54955 RepID=UPI001CC66BF3|nr:uncharacterized protein LOC122638854 [Telopea speciosissima]
MVFNRKFVSPREVIEAAMRAFKDFAEINLQKNGTTTNQPPQPRSSVWHPPPRGVSKINSNASLGTGKKAGGLGFVLRNSHGDCLRAVSKPAQFHTAIIREALAMRDAVLYALGDCVEKVVVESDSLDLVRLIQDTSRTSPSEIGSIVQDIRHLITYFVQCDIAHVFRETNSFPDSLSRRAMSCACETVWPNFIPWIQDLCNLDSSVVSRFPTE